MALIHVLPAFKLYAYKQRKERVLKLENLMKKDTKVKEMEEKKSLMRTQKSRSI